MALQIREVNGTYYVNGKINTNTRKSFMKYFSCVLYHVKKIVVDIKKVEEIDADGFRALHKIREIANYDYKEVSIIR